MSSISSLGIGSGLDLSGLLDKLTAAAQAPLTTIQSQQQTENTKLSAYGTLQGLLSQVKSAATQLSDPTFMGAFTAGSSATGVLSATAATGASGGTYSVNVSQLAQSQSLVCSDVADAAAAIGTQAATITIDLGTITGGTLANGVYSGASFAADPSKKEITLALAAGQTSLTQVRDAINAAAGTAVTASIVNDGAGNRLMLTSTQTGASASMKVSLSDGSGGPCANTALAALLANDPAATQNLQQTVAAQNAALTVNGIAVTSQSNTVASAIQGVTMTLAATGSSTVSVQRNTSAVQSAVSTFVGAYNSLNTALKNLTAYDPSQKSGGILLGDSATRIIESQLRNAITAVHAGLAGDPTTLTAIGVGFQNDGSLSVDSTKLSAALSSNPDGVARMLVGSPSSPGVAAGIASVIDGFNATGGVLAAATDGENAVISQLSDQAQRIQTQIDAQTAQYQKEFQNLDLVMSGLNATSTYLTQQFNAMMPSSSTTSKG